MSTRLPAQRGHMNTPRQTSALQLKTDLSLKADRRHSRNYSGKHRNLHFICELEAAIQLRCTLLCESPVITCRPPLQSALPETQVCKIPHSIQTQSCPCASEQTPVCFKNVFAPQTEERSSECELRGLFLISSERSLDDHPAASSSRCPRRTGGSLQSESLKLNAAPAVRVLAPRSLLMSHLSKHESHQSVGLTSQSAGTLVT